MKRRLGAVLLALCIGASGCGVRSGMENVDDAKQAKKQAEGVQKKLEREMNKGQEQLPDE